MEERLGLEKIDIHRAGDSVKSEVAISLILIAEMVFNTLQIH